MSRPPRGSRIFQKTESLGRGSAMWGRNSNRGLWEIDGGWVEVRSVGIFDLREQRS
jgi:hypothetical protein